MVVFIQLSRGSSSFGLVESTWLESEGVDGTKVIYWMSNSPLFISLLLSFFRNHWRRRARNSTEITGKPTDGWRGWRHDPRGTCCFQVVWVLCFSTMNCLSTSSSSSSPVFEIVVFWYIGSLCSKTKTTSTTINKNNRRTKTETGRSIFQNSSKWCPHKNATTMPKRKC